MTLNERLDIMGETPFLDRLYTQISLCYPIPSSASHSSIISTLKSGLERLSTSFPWVAGQVVQDSNGDYRIIPLEPAPRLTTKDLSDDTSVPSWSEMKAADFPISMLDEELICPRNTLPDPTAKDAPVFLVQVNWLQGGMILSILGQHNTMDMVGQAHIISLLSKACRGEPFTSQEIKIGNPDRPSIVPLLDASYKPGPELRNQLVPPPSPDQTTSATTSIPTPCTWSTFLFSPSSLATLKSTATSSLPNPTTTPYISTDDALTAFILQSVLRARSTRLSPDSPIQLARAVDARRYLNVPDTYPGLLLNMAYHTYPLSTLLSMSLGALSSTLRSAIDPATSDIAFRTRAMVTHVSRTSDKSSVNVTALINPSSDLMLSSWSKTNFYDYDFGFGLGKPEAVRRPRFVPVESLVYVLPRKGDGEVGVSLCLREGDLEGLRGDGAWSGLARYIG